MPRVRPASPIAVDGAKFAASVHGEMKLKCTDCHADVSADKLPHPDKLKPVNCATCHDKAVKEYAGTVHGTARKGGNSVAANCTDCHGTHDILRSKDPAAAHQSRQRRGDVLDVPRQRHDGRDGQAARRQRRRQVPRQHPRQGAEGRGAGLGADLHQLPRRAQHPPKADEKSRTNRARIPDTCGTCHKPERDAYMNGMHGKLRQDGVLAAPGCTDCHSAHGIQQHETPKFQTEVIKECGTCHADYLATYRDTFHGQVTALGYSRMATCASCHGAHDVLPASNPASKVSKQNRLKTCQTCHAGASANFASFDPHANRHDKARDPIFYYAAKFMEILLFGVFSFFGVHTILLVLPRTAGKTGPRQRQREALMAIATGNPAAWPAQCGQAAPAWRSATTGGLRRSSACCTRA